MDGFMGIPFGLEVIVMTLMCATASSQNHLTDPYDIFGKHFSAIGGLEQVKAESTSYFEATLSTSGLEGTITGWNKMPICERQQIDLGVFKQTTGDNGQHKWKVDSNGKLLIQKDENVLKRWELQKLNAAFDYLDRSSSTFTLTFEGITKVGDNDCYVVKTANNINTDYLLTFFNLSNFFIEKQIAYTPERESHTLFSDYRKVEGIWRSFQQDITDLPEGNTTTIHIRVFKPNIAIDTGLFEPPTEDVHDFRFADGNCSENVPFEYIWEHILLPVNIGGKERLWLLDTGAGISVIDSGFAADLGLKEFGDVKSKGAGSSASVSFVQLPPFSVKGLQFDAQVAATLDLKNVILKKKGMDAVVGILGYDFISRLVVKVDYAKALISFYDPQSFEYHGTGTILEAPLKRNILTVLATVDGKYTGRWELDLGADACDFHYPFARENGLLERKGIEHAYLGAGGLSFNRMIQFDSFELAGYKVENPIVGVTPEELPGSFGHAETAGNLGNDVLRHFVLYIDYNRQQVIIEPGDDYDRVFPVSRFPLQVMYNDKRQMEVIFVPDNSPISEAGFMAGDIVVAINDIGVEHLNGLIALTDLMKAEAGTSYEFTILRNGINLNLKAQLKELYDR
jgi:hypothetical protein